MKTRTQLGRQFRVVTIDGKTFRIQRKTFWLWHFIYTCPYCEKMIIREFDTQEQAQQCIERWVEQDYRAQHKVWKSV